MKTRKKVLAASLAVATSLTLTACDPPIPPEILASLAEQSYTCIEGEVSVAGPDSMQEVLASWADYLTYSCVDPEPVMTFSPVPLNDETASLVISEHAPSCKPSLSVPIAVDAAVLVYQESEVGSLNVSAESLAGIINGTVTNWDQLAEENPGMEMPSRPLLVRTAVDEAAFSAIEKFLTFSNHDVSTEILEPRAASTLSDYADFADGYWTSNLQEGEVAIIPNSFAIQLGLYPANIYQGLDQEGFPLVATPDVSGIGTAATQWVMKETDSNISVQLDPNKAPTPPDGSETAPPAYQAIYPISLNLCNPENLARAISRFMLRLDNQGSLAVSNYFPLPEFVRIAALVKVSEGLPIPDPVLGTE
jgi:phosphate transport system substrate-binding protein